MSAGRRAGRIQKGEFLATSAANRFFHRQARQVRQVKMIPDTAIETTDYTDLTDYE